MPQVIIKSMEWATGFPVSNKRVPFNTGKGCAIAAVNRMIYEKIVSSITHRTTLFCKIIYRRLLLNSSPMQSNTLLIHKTGPSIAIVLFHSLCFQSQFPTIS